MAADKALILPQIEADPGTDVMNDAVRAALREAAEEEFAKERLSFGSSWWNADTWPRDVLDGLVAEIQAGGGWQALLKKRVTQWATTDVFDEEAPLYKTIYGYIEFRTWGMRRSGPLGWRAMKAKLAELEEAAAGGGGDGGSESGPDSGDGSGSDSGEGSDSSSNRGS